MSAGEVSLFDWPCPVSNFMRMVWVRKMAGPKGLAFRSSHNPARLTAGPAKAKSAIRAALPRPKQCFVGGRFRFASASCSGVLRTTRLGSCLGVSPFRVLHRSFASSGLAFRSSRNPALLPAGPEKSKSFCFAHLLFATGHWPDIHKRLLPFVSWLPYCVRFSESSAADFPFLAHSCPAFPKAIIKLQPPFSGSHCSHGWR